MTRVRLRRFIRFVALATTVALTASACGSGTSASNATENTLEGAAGDIFSGECAASTDTEITIYSGRDQELVGPVLDAFECSSGISVVTNFGDPTDLALTLVEEGDRTPADVFLSKSPGSVGFLQNEGFLQTLNDDLLGLVSDENTAANGCLLYTSPSPRDRG